MKNGRDFPNSGILFKSDEKKNSASPDLKGTLDVSCDKCGHRMQRTLVAWVKTARNGSKFFSLSCRPKDHQSAPQSKSEVNLDDFEAE